jgi:hypothetical protein
MSGGSGVIELATSRYHPRAEVVVSGLAPVGITVSPPRFPLGYRLAGTLAALAPHGMFGVEHPELFEQLYLERLDGFGAERIVAALAAIADLEQRPGCVLLC